MDSFAALVRRELGVYFTSAIAYVIFVLFMLTCGVVLMSSLSVAEERQLPVRFEETLGFVVGLIALLAPFFTMRLVAEERNQGTLESVLTAPVSETGFIMSKFLSSMLFLHFLVLLPLIGYPLLLGIYTDIDSGVVFSSYIGVLLFCSSLFAIGLFVSALCRNQITAGVITFIISILLGLLWGGALLLGRDGIWPRLLSRFDLLGGTQTFLRGVVDTRDIVFYLSVTVFFLFMSIRAVESRRWR